MVKRIVILILLLLTVGVEAQQSNPRLRARWGSRVTGLGEPQAPSIIIDTPTLNPAITVTSSTLTLSGTAEAGTAAIESVTWVNDRGGSGTASGTLEWETATSSGAAVVVQDAFASAGTQPLEGLIAVPIGGAWSEFVDSSAGVNLERRSGGYVQINTNLANGRVAYKVAPSTPIIGTNYDAAVTLKHIENSDGDDPAAIIFGQSDSDDYCAVTWYFSGAATDLYLTKSVAGTFSTIGAGVNIDPAFDDVISVEVRGVNITVKQNGVSKITTALGDDCDNATGVGLGVGGFRGVAGDDGSTRWRFDDFTVTDQDAAAGGITLQSGVNVITVTATDTNDLTATDIITVTLAGADTTDPLVTITSPTTNPTQNTSVAAITIEGTCTDNIACTAVTLDCADCSPVVNDAVCTLSGSGTSKTFICPVATQTATTNELIVTAVDAATNDDIDQLDSTYTAGDVTAPVITITSGGGSPFSTAINPYTLLGNATDAVGVTGISCSCDACGVGTPTVGSGTSVNWSIPLTLTAGVNNVSCTARDQANNISTPDTIAITYSPGVLTVTPASLPNGRVGDPYPTVPISATGGTAPYTFTNNGAGTSLNDSDPQCAGLLVQSDGDIVGTPTAEGVCNWTGKVTDNVAATDTEPFTITVLAAGSEGPHDFFNAAIVRGDCYKAYSFRPQPGITQPSAVRGVSDCSKSNWTQQLTFATGTTFITYDYAGDTNVEKQDGAKVVIPQWRTSIPNLTLTAPMGTGAVGEQQTITVSAVQGIETGKAWKIENEIVIAPFSQSNSTSIIITRGGFNTTPVTHSSGVTVQNGSNSLSTGQQTRVPINTDGDVSANYLYVADLYYTNSFMKTGLVNHKVLQVAYISSGNQFVETNSAYGGPFGTAPNPAWAANGGVNTYVAVFGTRFYSQSTTPGAFQDAPGRPFANPPFLMKPSKWLRFWIYIEANAETDPTKFVTLSAGRAPITASIDASTTSISYDHTGINTSPLTACPFLCAGTGFPGRSIKIDNEIMTISACTVCTGTTRTITVVRGAQGTTPATHTLGTQIQLIEDYVTIWVADEETEPTLMYDRVSWHLPTNHSSLNVRGSMADFWVEFNTSTAQTTAGRANGADGTPGTADDFADMVAYVRNLVVLKNPPADWSSLRVKPVR